MTHTPTHSHTLHITPFTMLIEVACTYLCYQTSNPTFENHGQSNSISNAKPSHYDTFRPALRFLLLPLNLFVAGPGDTVYAGGCWLAYVRFPIDYPMMGPEIRFVTPIHHCNVNTHGKGK